MNRRSRQKLVRAAERLQAAYAAGRVVERARFEALAATGAFLAPEHLRPGLQATLPLAVALEADEIQAEAA